MSSAAWWERGEYLRADTAFRRAPLPGIESRREARRQLQAEAEEQAAEQRRRERREYDAGWFHVVDALERAGINPRDLRDYLANLPD